MQVIPGSGRSPGLGNGNSLQDSCLENPMDRGAWWAIVHGVTKESDTTQLLNNNNFMYHQQERSGIKILMFIVIWFSLWGSGFLPPVGWFGFGFLRIQLRMARRTHSKPCSPPWRVNRLGKRWIRLLCFLRSKPKVCGGPSPGPPMSGPAVTSHSSII